MAMGSGLPPLLAGMPIMGQNPFVGPGAFAGLIPRAGTSHMLSPGGVARMDARKGRLAAPRITPGVPSRGYTPLPAARMPRLPSDVPYLV